MMLATSARATDFLQMLASFITGIARTHEGVINTVQLQFVLAYYEFTGLDDLDPTLNCLKLAAFDFFLKQKHIGWGKKAIACSKVFAHN